MRLRKSRAEQRRCSRRQKVVRSAAAKVASGTSRSSRWLGVRTPILGRPRPSPRHRRANHDHTPTTPPTVMSQLSPLPTAQRCTCHALRLVGLKVPSRWVDIRGRGFAGLERCRGRLCLLRGWGGPDAVGKSRSARHTRGRMRRRAMVPAAPRRRPHGREMDSPLAKELCFAGLGLRTRIHVLGCLRWGLST